MNFEIEDLKKYIIFVIFLIIIILFYTRPELNVSSHRYIEVLKSFYYNTYRGEKAVNSDFSYRSIGISNTNIYYVHFKDEENCKEYYASLTANSKGKPMRSLYRDQRITGASSEYLSYEDEDMFYIFLYTRNAVMYSKTYSSNKTELMTIFKTLNEKEKLGFNDMIAYYMDYFANLPEKIAKQKINKTKL